MAAPATDRRAVFAAALEQAEQLALAAGSVGYASRPLPLFYSLSQAGRAIAAARADEPWRCMGHGLGFSARAPVVSSTIRPARNKGRTDSFGVVATAIGSPDLPATDLATLWHSLPELHELPGIDALRPKCLAPELGDFSTIGHRSVVVLGMSAADIQGGALGAWAGGDGVEFRRHHGTWGVAVGWPGAPGQDKFVFEVAYHLPGAFWLRPKINGEIPPSPLMTWWALVYALSTLARYEPERWVSALNIDESPHAANLEQLLDTALWRLPELIAGALSDEFIKDALALATREGQH